MTFDVSQYELADTAVLTFKTARGDGPLIGADGKTPAKAVIYSPGSEQGVRTLHKAGKQSQIRLVRAMKGEVMEDDAERADREAAEKLAGFTAEFINFPLDPIKVYSNPRLVYMAKQVEQFVGNYGSFSKGSSEN